jgi:hypothetical protein
MTIASPRIEALAQRLAEVTGEDPETAVERALQERLSRVTSLPGAHRKEAWRRFVELGRRTPVKDDREIDEIIGYGPDGLPE